MEELYIYLMLIVNCWFKKHWSKYRDRHLKITNLNKEVPWQYLTLMILKYLAANLYKI